MIPTCSSGSPRAADEPCTQCVCITAETLLRPSEPQCHAIGFPDGIEGRVGCSAELDFRTITFPQSTGLKQLLRSHDMKYQGALAIVPIENAAWRLNDLPISRPLQLRRPATTFGVGLELLHVPKDPLNQLGSGRGIFDRNVIGNGIQIAERRLSPDYFSHRSIRVLASAWLVILPSATAISPRAIPSSTAIRRCRSSKLSTSRR